MPTILIIDADAVVRRLLRDVLEPLGHTVLEAGDGATCAGPPPGAAVDLVFCDPRALGRGLRQAIAALRARRARARVVAMSSGGADALQFLRAAHRLGADFAIEKPFRTAAVRTLAAGLLAGVAERLNG